MTEIIFAFSLFSDYNVQFLFFICNLLKLFLAVALRRCCYVSKITHSRYKITYFLNASRKYVDNIYECDFFSLKIELYNLSVDLKLLTSYHSVLLQLCINFLRCILFFYEVSCFLTDHNGRSIRVPADNIWHYASINHS